MQNLIRLAMVVWSYHAAASIRVVTSTTDLAWAVKQIGGESVDVKALLRGTENPHYVDSVPDFVRQVADAQVVCLVGLDLEIGWMPKILSRSGNAKVQPGGAGYCDTGRGISVLDKPLGAVDRSMGDVHPAGNPHYWLSPLHLVQAARQIVTSLSSSDPTNAEKYEAGLTAFSKKIDGFYDQQKRKIAAVARHSNKPVIMEYHQEFAYLLNAYGLQSAGSLEEKPGVAPSSGRIARVAMDAKANRIRVLLAADYSPRQTLEKFRELSGVLVLVVPTSMPATGSDYFAFHASLVDRLVAALTPTANGG